MACVPASADVMDKLAPRADDETNFDIVIWIEG
jgi:hypothetical protein